jgi:hypothetical protein
MKSALPVILVIFLGCAAGRNMPDDSLSENLLLSNLEETPYTAHVKTTSVEKNKEIRSDSGEIGYVVFKVQAEVIETFKGDKKSTIEYFVMHEAPSKGPRLGEDLIASLNRSEEGEYYVPDNGYELPATKSLIRLARSWAKDSRGPGQARDVSPSPQRTKVRRGDALGTQKPN